MLERLKAMEERYNQLNNELMQQETLTNIQRTTEISSLSTSNRRFRNGERNAKRSRTS